jgi:hypothetical protein
MGSKNKGGREVRKPKKDAKLKAAPEHAAAHRQAQVGTRADGFG